MSFKLIFITINDITNQIPIFFIAKMNAFVASLEVIESADYA